MEPLITAGLIAAGSSLAGTGGQMIAQGKMNKKTRKFNEQNREIMRKWALEDWQRVNEYNSPKMQMQRLKEAGLNPNLVYGNGADATVGPVRQSEGADWKPQAAEIQAGIGQAAGTALSAYQNAEHIKLQNNLLRSQDIIAQREAQLKATQEMALQLGILDKRFDLNLKEDMRPYNLQFRKKQVETLDQNIMESLTRMGNSTWQMNLNQQENERRQSRFVSDMSTADIQRQLMRLTMNKSEWEVKQIKQNIANLEKQGKMQGMLNDLQERMGETGITNSDPAWLKMLTKFMQDIRDGVIK